MHPKKPMFVGIEMSSPLKKVEGPVLPNTISPETVVVPPSGPSSEAGEVYTGADAERKRNEGTKKVDIWNPLSKAPPLKVLNQRAAANIITTYTNKSLTGSPNTRKLKNEVKTDANTTKSIHPSPTETTIEPKADPTSAELVIKKLMTRLAYLLGSKSEKSQVAPETTHKPSGWESVIEYVKKMASHSTTLDNFRNLLLKHISELIQGRFSVAYLGWDVAAFFFLLGVMENAFIFIKWLWGKYKTSQKRITDIEQ